MTPDFSIFAWAAVSVALYALAVRGSRALARPLKRRALKTADKLLAADLSPAARWEVENSLAMLNSGMHAWLIVLAIPAAFVSSVIDRVKKRTPTPTPLMRSGDDGLVREYIGFVIASVVLNSPLAAVLVLLELLLYGGTFGSVTGIAAKIVASAEWLVKTPTGLIPVRWKH